MRAAFLAILAVFTACLVALCAAAPSGATLVASGFSWAENVWPVAEGEIFVNDLARGTITKITWAGNSAATSTLWVSGFNSCAGLAGHPTFEMFYLYALCELPNGTDSVIAFSTQIPNSYTILIANNQVSGNFSWNGLAYDPSTQFLYVTNLGGFAAGRGNILAYDKNFRQYRFASGMNVADGAFYSLGEGILYVSEAFSATIHLYGTARSATNGAISQLRNFTAPGCKTVDDFSVFLWQGSFVMVAADYSGGNVVQFDAHGIGSGKVLATGFINPTSARRGKGADSGFVFVTESGGTIADSNRGVWKVPISSN